MSWLEARVSEACRRYISKQEIIDRADEVFQYLNSLENEIDLLRAEVEKLTDEKFRHGGAFQQFEEEPDGR